MVDAAHTTRHPAYWKVKAAFLEQQQVVGRAQAAVSRARATVLQVMQEAGLDPKVAYTMDDATESITATKSDHETGPPR